MVDVGRLAVSQPEDQQDRQAGAGQGYRDLQGLADEPDLERYSRRSLLERITVISARGAS